MHFAVIGCGHGEIDKIYEVILDIELKRGIKVDIVLCCGDFQSVRNMTDLRCMACPIKYQQMHDFHKYYSGEKKAPILTLFIGGNHEASNYLQELPFGGWVAPNIYYLGNTSVVQFGPLRIIGISGIYKGHDYLKGRHEVPPYSQDTMRSVYHYRNIDFFRLKQIRNKIDIVLSHDWPRGIYNYGNVNNLLRQKPFFREQIERDDLGSRPLADLLETLQPSYWFSAHMHVKFAALMTHPVLNNHLEEKSNNDNSDSETKPAEPEESPKPKTTRFLALDKILPRRQFLQIIEIPKSEGDQPEPEPVLSYDPEWLSILKSTDSLTSVRNGKIFMPGPGGNERYDFTTKDEDIEEILRILENNIKIPENFEKTAPEYKDKEKPGIAKPLVNPQTAEFCDKFNVTDPLNIIMRIPLSNADELSFNLSRDDSQMNITLNNSFTQVSLNPEEIELNLDDDDNTDADGDNGAKSSSNNQHLSTPTSSRSKLNLPPPKDTTTTKPNLLGNENETSDSVLESELLVDDQDQERKQKELQVFQSIFPSLDSSGATLNESYSQMSGSGISFSIDRVGDGNDNDNDNSSISQEPNVKRKRRNYIPDDDNDE